jgi:alpha-beta hydrolase superfamily lysophospholipase
MIPLVLFGVVLLLVWLAGSSLSAAKNLKVHLPPDPLCEPVQFKSDSGSLIHGSFIQGQSGKGAVILMHGIRGSRAAMAGHAQFLAKQGFSVLLFDFQAHGESLGSQITFGLLESLDAAAALKFFKSRVPGEKIGVLGSSLGGAAVALCKPPLEIDACVLEMVYSEIKTAIANRLAIRLGNWARILTPLLSVQLRPRLGVSCDAFRPVDTIKNLRCPKLIIGGSEDRHTTEAETRALFNAASEPKELWIIPGAYHQDLRSYVGDSYEIRIGEFFRKYLSR